MESRITRSLFAASFALTSALVGCAAPEESDAIDHEDLVANADEVIEQHDLGESSQAVSAQPIDPGECTSKTLTCMPDLTVSVASVVKYDVGNAQGATPGYYVTFAVKNRGSVAAEAFDVDVRNEVGQLVSTRAFAGLPANTTKTFTQYHSLVCGWAFKASADADQTVDEYLETNNAVSYWNNCPYSTTPTGTSSGPTVGGTIPLPLP